MSTTPSGSQLDLNGKPSLVRFAGAFLVLAIMLIPGFSRQQATPVQKQFEPSETTIADIG